ncbi:MAG: heme lyase CcmF/NrfE family subunit [Alphaproteobacteria bacterium]|nr:MAG: heme lyase CcmF/NrfE family subunit [Alphaproteobacteria bacterium]
MIAEVGQYALILAFMVALAQGTLPLWGAHRRDWRLMALAGHAAIGQAVLIAVAAACLVHAFVTTDLSVLLVVMHSNSAMPLLYKVTATWGNHEGSLLLWVLVLALFGASLAAFSRALPETMKARVLAVQGLIGAAFLALMLFTSNPFTRIHPAPMDGQELNPLLQDIGLAFHPPFLYLGYVGFSVTFAFAIAALIEGRVDAAWARLVRPWVLAAWIFLTIGITLGSWWAYYELGWGGWWFWDPVENASFMPWLVGTALLHSALVVERRQALVVWTVLLAILTFSLSLIGTFLVRSGVLTSVHAFATDPSRGVAVLLILFAATGGGLTLFGLRAHAFSRPVLFAPVSREGSLVLNNVLLVTAAGTVFLGTFYPLIAELLWGEKLSVGAPYFNLTFVPIMIPLLLAAVVGPVMNWKRDNLRASLARLRWPAAISALVAVALAVAGQGFHPLAAFGLGLGAWLVLGSLAILARRMRIGEVPASRSIDLLRRAPRAVFGLVLAHLGLGLAVVGITATSAFEEERIVSLLPGEAVEIAGYSVRLERVARLPGPNFEAEQARFTVYRDGAEVATMTSERRFFPVSGNLTTEAGIRPFFLSNLYLALGQPGDDGKWVVRAYHHPMVLLIWIGPIFMALGGLISLADRRLRIGVPQRAAAVAVAGIRP